MSTVLISLSECLCTGGVGGLQRFFRDFLLWFCLEPLPPIGKVHVF